MWTSARIGQVVLPMLITDLVDVGRRSGSIVPKAA